MGANTFSQVAKGKTSKEAFSAARERAIWDYGHAGYTGTLAEKSEYVIIPLAPGKTPDQYANELIDADDRRISDKWGPAGCIPCGNGEYLFFGWASS